MKTIQIGTGKEQVIQFDTLEEIRAVFSEKEIVKNFNFGYKHNVREALKRGGNKLW